MYLSIELYFRILNQEIPSFASFFFTPKPLLY